MNKVKTREELKLQEWLDNKDGLILLKRDQT